MTQQKHVKMNKPTNIAISSGKHNKSLATSHQEDFSAHIETKNFQGPCMKNGKIKPLFFVSIDGDPEKAPKNSFNLDYYLKIFIKFDLDLLGVFTHAPRSSA